MTFLCPVVHTYQMSVLQSLTMKFLLIDPAFHDMAKSVRAFYMRQLKNTNIAMSIYIPGIIPLTRLASDKVLTLIHCPLHTHPSLSPPDLPACRSGAKLASSPLQPAAVPLPVKLN